MASADLPKWVWDLVIVMQQHQDMYGKQDPNPVKAALAAVPADVRQQAEGIAAYVRLSTDNVMADKIKQQWSAMMDSLRPPQAGPSRDED
jgi:hypothetical protein